MPAFHFRGQAVLELRRRREEAALREQAEAQGRLDAARAALAEATERTEASVRGAASDAHNPAAMLWYGNWITRQRRTVEERGREVVDRAAALAAADERVRAAHRDVRAIERLRERAYRTWRREEDRREQKELDWLGALEHARRAGRQQEAS